MARIRLIRSGLVFLVVIFTGHSAYAIPIRGIEFPQGEASFADAVIRFDPLHTGGPAATAANAIDPISALGAPDTPVPFTNGDPGHVSLGRGGLIELAFTDNVLTNSGDDNDDLHIFEVGSDVEATFVAIRPVAATLLLLNPALDSNGDGYFEIGSVQGSVSSIDIDAFFSGFAAGTLRFDAVQLIDDRNEGGTSGATVGADIDAVGAISSDVPEPATIALLLSCSAAIAGRSRRTNSAQRRCENRGGR